MSALADPPRTQEIGDVIGTRSEVAAALLELSEQDREVLLLSAWYDLTARQASVVMGCTAATFAVRLHRARKRFATALAHADRTQPGPATRPQLHIAQRESA